MSYPFQSTKYAIVMRMEGLYPVSLGRFETHRLRDGGDLGHVDDTKTNLNKRLIGEKDWLEKTLLMIDEMKAFNHHADLTSLKKRRRKAEFDRRVAEGPKDPWLPTKHGPMREVILTANHQFFAEDLGEFFGEGVNHREQEFERIAVKWLIDNFGDDVVHAHADRDETAYHIHAVIVPRVRVDVGVHKNTAIRERLQPSKHELIRYYEKAQDSVGEAFAGLGLVRGERRRAAYREAMQAGQEPAPYRAHVKTRTWRMEQDLLLKEREAKVEAREADADAILMVAEAIAAGDVDPEATAEALGAGRVETVEDAPGITAANLDDEDAKAKLPEADRVVAKAGANPERLASVRKAVTRAPKATKRVFTAFGAAWKRLRGDAELQAEEGLRTAFDEVRAAEKEITRIASTLAPKERARITAARGSLGDRIRKLTLRFARSKVADDRNKPRRREDEQKGGKDQQ